MPPSTNGLTRSPPGVATAEKIAIPRMTIRREAASRCEVTMPTRDRPDEQDRELHDQPEHEEHRRHEVEVLAGRGARISRPSPPKLNRNVMAYGRTT